MITKIFKVTDEAGIHARPATVLIETVKKFESEVTLKFNEKEINLKSILGLLSLGMELNSEFEVSVEGRDEVVLMDTLGAALIQEGIASQL